MAERNFRTTHRAHKDFAESAIWQDYCEEIANWLADIHSALETADQMEEIYRYQGRAEACKQFLIMPEYITAAFERGAAARGEPSNGAGL